MSADKIKENKNIINREAVLFFLETEKRISEALDKLQKEITGVEPDVLRSELSKAVGELLSFTGRFDTDIEKGKNGEQS